MLYFEKNLQIRFDVLKSLNTFVAFYSPSFHDMYIKQILSFFNALFVFHKNTLSSASYDQSGM